MEAINDEMDSIMGTNTSVFKDLPLGRKSIGCKWIFRKKMNIDGTIDKFKARLVAQGFRKTNGVDHFDTYAPVARITTIRLLVGIAPSYNILIHQLDVKITFLYGDLEEEIYMRNPKGFIMKEQEQKVCKLVKSLYGLKQAPKQWHQKFDETILLYGFKLNQSDKCVYSKFNDKGNDVIICLYVDDMLIFSTSLLQAKKVNDYLSSVFKMKDMGEADIILGLKIIRSNDRIILSQSHYIEKILKRFDMLECCLVSTPLDGSMKLLPYQDSPISQLSCSKIIRSLMYAMTSTRLDITYVVGKLSRYTSNPRPSHWIAI